MKNRTKVKHENAIILNLSGHKLPQSIFDTLKEEGHKHFIIFSEHIHIDPDADMYEQCYKITSNFINRSNQNNVTFLSAEGERYFVSAGYSQASLIIYNAVASLLGYNPSILITGINKFKFQEHECKEVFNMQAWMGRWRSIERNKYLNPD